MHSPVQDAAVPDDFARLFELFAWENRHVVYHLAFSDGEEYEIPSVTAARDEGEPPHGTARVLRTLRTNPGTAFDPRNAMFFALVDVAAVADVVTGESLYPAR
jgi:hypothetical protein